MAIQEARKEARKEAREAEERWGAVKQERAAERSVEEAAAREAEEAVVKEGIERAAARDVVRDADRLAAAQKIQALQRGKLGRRRAQKRKQTREELYAKGIARQMTEVRSMGRGMCGGRSLVSTEV